jgi:hypothetical protein|tara:strand:+ start:1184 stop:1501 length:318 start_codon:yes stop_codon:yes gene_type:complete
MSNYQTNYDLIKWDRSHYQNTSSKKQERVAGPYVQGDYKPYECPITGNIIDGKKEHAQNLEKHGCRVHEKGEFEEVKKNGKKHYEQELDRAIDKAAQAAAREIDW